MERSYIAFISYKHTERDAAIAKRVHTLIESYVVPKSLRTDGKKLGVVFRDEEELTISSNLTESICTALDASRYLIVICSPEAKESPWVAREVNYFLQNHDASNAFVVLADGEPNDVFPLELTRALNPATGEYEEVEPLAMDVRADSIGASLKKVKAHIKKLYAGMLGCSYDRLVQREKARRMKRLITLGALGVLLVSSFTGMLFVKNRELTQKNDELTAAIELALNRESELLVGQADEALQEGDVAAALRHASSALYSQEIQRPYYAPAERTLFSALDIFREQDDTPLLAKAALKHHAPVEMMVCSADGSTVYTIDTYGTVSSFDASNGDLLWSVKLAEADVTYIDKVDPQLWYDADSGILACYYDRIFTGLDGRTGKTAWQSSFDPLYCSGAYHDAAGQKLAYIGSQSFTDWDDYSQSYTDYCFITISIADGRLLQSIPIIRMPGFSPVTFGSALDKRSSGMFIDSTRFVGSLFKPEDGTTKTFLYTVDLTQGTTSMIANEALTRENDYYRTVYVGDDKALVLSDISTSDPQTGFFTNELQLQCFDLKAGSLLWENVVTPEASVISTSHCYVIPNKKSIVIGIGANMLAFDSASGELQAAKRQNDEIISLYSLADGLFAFTLADGYCAVGWRSKSDFCDSRLYASTVDLPDTPAVLPHHGGLIRVYFTANRIDGFSIRPPQDGGGSIVYLSEDRCTAYVTTALPQPVLPAPVPVAAQLPDMNGIGDFIDMNHQGQFLLGLAYMQDGYGLSVVDAGNHSLEVIKLADYLSLSGKDLHLSSDGRKVLVCTNDGEIYSLAMDGNVTSIAESESVTLKIVGDTEFVDQVFYADAARQTSDGRILTVRSDGRELSLWFDGEKAADVPLPENVRWRIIDGFQSHAMIHAGENGLIVLSDFASDSSTRIANFVVYDLSSRKWKLIPDAGRGSHERTIVFGENAPVFAVYDEDMNIRVYDGKAEKLLCCISTELPMVSVVKTGLLLDDRFVYVFTKDGQFIIYSVETGQQIFRTLLSRVNGAADFSQWLDKANRRLYLRLGTRLVCIDMRSWEQLFSCTNFKFYNPWQNEVYIFSRDRGTTSYSLKALPIPTTSELTDIALNTLQENR